MKFIRLEVRQKASNPVKKKLSFLWQIVEWTVSIVLFMAILTGLANFLPTKKFFSLYIVSTGSMKQSVPAGSVALVIPYKNAGKGTIIAFQSPVDSAKTIIHRIAGEKKEATGRIFYTKGDNNSAADLWEVKENQVLGTVILAIPLLGQLSVSMRTPLGFSVFIVMPALWFLVFNIKLVRQGINEEVQKKIMIASRNGRGMTLFLIMTTSLAAGFFIMFSSFNLAQAVFASLTTISGFSFTTEDFVAPNYPLLLAPVDDSYRNTAGLVMDWSDVSDYEDMSPPVYYIYQSARNSGFSPLAYQSGNLFSSQIPAPGTPDGEYWWRVKTCDAIDNCSLWSAAFKVTVDSTAPSSPSWVTPADNSYTNQSQNILLDWSDSLDANLSGYEYENTGPGGTWKSVDSCGLLTQSQIPNSQIGIGGSCINAPAATLSVDGSYFRKVRAKDKAGNYSNWSSIFKLTRDTAVPSSIFITPSENVEYLGGPVPILGSSTDNYTIDNVRLYYSQYAEGTCSADWMLFETIDNPLNNSPFNWSYSWTPAEAGNYCLKAKASDLAGNIEASPVVANLKFYLSPILEARRISDGKKVNIRISPLDEYASYAYRMTYKHEGKDEGYFGNVILTGENISEREFILGSCSEISCIYFAGISDIRIDIDVFTPGGSVLHLGEIL